MITAQIISAYPYSRKEIIEYIEKCIIPIKKYSKTTIDNINLWNEDDVGYSYEEYIEEDCGTEWCDEVLKDMINDGVIKFVVVATENGDLVKRYSLTEK